MDNILNTILKDPHHLEFFKKYGYVKYSGCESKKHNLHPKITLMLPIGMSEAELAEKYEQWGKG